MYEIARGKINLDLRVCGCRPDGYHDLDSLVAFTEFGDRLTFAPADDLTLSIVGPFAALLEGEVDNLVLRAARLAAFLAGRPPNVRITLEKRLPVAAGLGGGSADAAATLRGLRRLWNLPSCFGDFASLAGELGADVPVCLWSKPTRIQGIGERLTRFDLPGNLPILLVNPGVALATGPIFKKLETMSGERSTAMVDHDAMRFFDMLRDGVNDLEAPARSSAAVIDDVLHDIESQPGCELARMSGSGATCFGLFADQATLDRAARRLRAANPGWWIVETICR